MHESQSRSYGFGGTTAKTNGLRPNDRESTLKQMQDRGRVQTVENYALISVHQMRLMSCARSSFSTVRPNRPLLAWLICFYLFGTVRASILQHKRRSLPKSNRYRQQAPGI